MKKKPAEQETIQKQKGLPNECIEAIKSHDFATAERKLQEIKDNSKINLIIKEVYNYQIANFDLVLKFGDDIKNIERSFLVYKALNYEMESNGHNDSVKVKKLIEGLERKIINQENTSNDVKKEACSLAGKLIAKLSEGNINPLLYKTVSNIEVLKSFVEAMEERGISVSTAKDNDGDSLLHKAAMNGHLDVVTYLINEKRVSISIKNNAGCTPLNVSINNSNLSVNLCLLCYDVWHYRPDVSARYLTYAKSKCINECHHSVQKRSLISHEPTSNLKDIASVENLNNLTNKHL